jgi:transcriptional regulator with XRE-family HTH domain
MGMFPEKIKELRAKKGLSQGDVARTLFVTQQAVSKWESGKGYPDLPTLQALAKLYGVPVDDLVGTEEYSEAKKINSAKISPVFAILLGVYVLAAILCAVFSGTLVQLYERTLGSDALSRALGLTALIAFFSSCLALVLFVLLSQSQKLRLIRFCEWDGVFFCLLFLVLFVIAKGLGSNEKSDAVYLLIGVSALYFSALFFYYERETLLCERQAGLAGIALTPFEEKILKQGAKKHRLFLAAVLIVLGLMLLPIILYIALV